MTLADYEVKLKAHAYLVSPGVVALIPKSGTIEEMRQRSKDVRTVDVMFVFYATIEEYKKSAASEPCD